jgi:ribosome biogenesis GTPase
VETETGVVRARLRGRLKQGKAEGDIVALGDWVQVSIPDTDGEGEVMVEEVQERTRALVREAPRARGPYEQIIVANPDQALFVMACADPEPNFGLLDRLLVGAEQQAIPAAVVANKTDLVGWREPKRLFGHYGRIGYRVYYTSALKGRGIGRLRKAMKSKLSVMAGPSGAGKSSLLNALQPELGLRAKEISQATGKGRHTTTKRQLFPLDFGGYVADTPGLKVFWHADLEPEELDGYFPEIAPLVAECQFSSCTHSEEPGCAVLAAVGERKVHPERYRSYMMMRMKIEEE